jgi:hypothetical protein
MSSLEGANMRLYLWTYAILVVTTIIEVALFVAAFRLNAIHVDLRTLEGFLFVLALVFGVAILKVWFIAMNYMHIKWEPRSIVILGFSPVLFIIVMLAVFVLLGDYSACNQC